MVDGSRRHVEETPLLRPHAVLGFGVFELYAVSPEGKVLARYPHMP